MTVSVQPETEVRRSSKAYCSVLLVLPVLGILALTSFASTKWYRDCRDGAWFEGGDAVFTARGARCDILIFGDSTAVTGLNSQLIQRESGLTTCNISQSIAVLSTLKFAPLDLFLSRNQQPKYLVFQFTPEDLAPIAEPTGSNVDGLYDLLWFFPPTAAVGNMVQHPDEFLALPSAVMSQMAHHTYRVLRNRVAPIQHSSAGALPDAFFTVPLPPWVNCGEHDDSRPDRPPSAAWVAALRSSYGHSAGHVLVNVAPTADCDPRYEAVRKATEGLTDNEYERFPIRMFNDRLVHFSEEGSTRLSLSLVRQIALLERADSLTASSGGP